MFDPDDSVATTVFKIIVVFVILVVISTLLTCWIWGWVVPDVFQGAVKTGLLPAKITFWQAFKLSILFSVLGLTGKYRSSKKD